jgi:protein phosphatase
VQAGLIDEQTALAHPDRHFISNVVGEADMRIEMGPKVELSPRDTILIGSDGLYDNFSYGELSNLVRIGHSDAVLENLVGRLDRKLRPVENPPDDIKFDDVSFITLRLAI